MLTIYQNKKIMEALARQNVHSLSVFKSGYLINSFSCPVCVSESVAVVRKLAPPLVCLACSMQRFAA